MAEFESLASDEALDAHIRRHGYDRLIMLSDGIFAIATTLAALEIRLPEHAATLDQMIAAAGRTILAYAISFVIIAVFWISSRDLFARLLKVDRVLTLLTLAMLCAVAVIPACAHIIYVQGHADASFSFYALTMTVCGLLNGAMWTYASLRPGLMRAEVPRRYRWERISISATMPLLFGTLFLIPTVRAAAVLAPVAVVLVLVRRLVIPWWFRRQHGAGHSSTAN